MRQLSILIHKEKTKKQKQNKKTKKNKYQHTLSPLFKDIIKLHNYLSKSIKYI